MGAPKGNKNRLGHYHSEEAKRKMSEARRGKATGPHSEERRQKVRDAWTPEKKAQISAKRRGTRYGREAEGFFVDPEGYRRLTGHYDHPLANKGALFEHRKVLYDKIGPGPHLCHWGCGKVLEWGGRMGLIVDHLDEDRLNNDPTNLVPSCFRCNIRRGL